MLALVACATGCRQLFGIEPIAGDGGGDGGGDCACLDHPGDSFHDAPVDVPAMLTLPAVADTYLNGQQKANNYGAADPLLYANLPNTTAVPLMRFDVPHKLTIASAELHLFIMNNGASGELAELFQVMQTWDEGTQNGSLGLANWTVATSASNWSAPGAGGAARGTTVLAQGSVSNTGATTLVLNQAGLAVLQGWSDDPVNNPNFGFVVDSNMNVPFEFSSREDADATRVPTLVIATQ